MPVPFPIVDNEKIKYQVPAQTKMFLCNYCNQQTNCLRWIEKFRSENFKCEDCWTKN
jgi:hypothetical protein